MTHALVLITLRVTLYSEGVSIRTDGHEMQKAVWRWPNREEIRAVVHKVKSSVRGHGEKIYPAPILGLLLYDQDLLRKFDGKAPLDELELWSQRELHVLFGVHEQIRAFNERCLSPLAAELPQCVDAVNPYKQYPITTKGKPRDEFFFRTKEAENAINSFHTHPAFQVALDIASAVKGLDINYHETIWQLDSEIVNSGPGGESEWVKRYENATRWGAENVDMFRHVGALLCLYNALANLNELIYLGLFQDDLIHLDRSTVIKYSWTTGGAGPSMWLLHLPAGFMFLFEPTDLITVNIDKPGQKGGLGDKLCQICRQTLRGMSYPGTLQLRMIDDNLSSYPYLIK